jgi:hypothetical protein
VINEGTFWPCFLVLPYLEYGFMYIGLDLHKPYAWACFGHIMSIFFQYTMVNDKVCLGMKCFLSMHDHLCKKLSLEPKSL